MILGMSDKQFKFFFYMKLKILTITLFIGVQVFAQEQLPLENLNAFKPQAGNWQLVGEIPPYVMITQSQRARWTLSFVNESETLLFYCLSGVELDVL